MATTVAASRKHVELSLELKRKLIQEHEHGVPFTLLGKKYHIATSTAANIWRKKDFFLRSRMSGSRKRCNDRSKYKIVNQVTALFVKRMLERNHKIDGEVIKRFARSAAAQCNFKDFHGSNGWLDSFKKRENVCWVRRRGASSSSNALVVQGPTAAMTSNSSECTNSNSCPSTITAASGVDVRNTNSISNLANGCDPSSFRMSDSPNLSTAATAAAAIAVAARSHLDHQHLDNQNPHSLSPDRCWDSESENGATGVGGTCARCSVAAAAAAVAALNSSDSIHEREHEINDWFHGIPFLCQFFEEYQNMHQQQQQQQQQLEAPAITTNSRNLLLSGPKKEHNNVQSYIVSVASTPTSSSCSIASSSSSSVASSSRGIAATCCSGSSASDNLLASAPTGCSRLGASESNCIIRSMSDAHELMDSANGITSQFKASSSLADIQSLGSSGESSNLQCTCSNDMLATRGQHASQHYEMAYETSKTPFQPPADQFNSIPRSSLSPTYTNGNSDTQSMEINFNHQEEHEVGVNQQASGGPNNDHQTHQQQMDCLMMSKGSNESACCHIDECTRQRNQTAASQQNAPNGARGQSSGNSCPMTIASDYNSDDQEFYMQSATRAYMTQSSECQSDDPLYHDEVSDHNDCCSDHYDTSASTRRDLQLQDYHSDLTAAASCYLDEYEYENISTIRHYPVPMPSQAQGSNRSGTHFNPTTGTSTQDTSATSRSQTFAPSTGGSSNQQHSGETHSYEQQMGAQASFISNISRTTSGEQNIQTEGIYTCGQQVSNSMVSSLSANNSADDGHYRSLTRHLSECEPSVEHADHEEHNLLHNALMRSPEKLKLIDSIITLLNYASNYNQKMLAPLFEIKRCIERDLEVVLSDTTNAISNGVSSGQQQNSVCCSRTDEPNEA